MAPERIVVLETPNVPRAPSHPSNQKIEDSLMLKPDWTQEELDQMCKIVDYYLATRYECDTLQG